LIGRPVKRLYSTSHEEYNWWIEGENGEYYQNDSEDGETIMKLVLQPDDSIVEEEMGDDIWVLDKEGREIYWGVSVRNQAVKWVRGEAGETQVYNNRKWTIYPGAPSEFIPLLKGFLRGDPGYSMFTQTPVGDILLRRLRNSGILAGISFVIIMPLSLLLGLIAGLNEGKFLDRLLSITGLVTTSIPEFTTGIVLIVVFAMWLGVLPGATVFSSDTAIFERPEMLVLPVLTLTLVEFGYVLRITRASLVDVMRKDYIRTARLKGLSPRKIVLKHAIRNALMAPITVIMLHLNWLIGGLVVVEAIFGYPGLGRYVYDASLFNDVFAVEAASMTLVVIAVVTQFIADIIYTYLNPRIRYT
jgi:peptide/nickel transport system permease protein